MPCHKPGSLTNTDEWKWASNLFRSPSLGEGLYHAVLFSMDIMEIIATAAINVTAETIEFKPPATEAIVPPDSGLSMGGGLRGCQALVVASACCMGGNSSSCVKVPDPTGFGELDDASAGIPQRCGDGKLELGRPEPFLVPLNSAKERDGRTEECDDGNNVNADGCDTYCQIEANTNCSYFQNFNFSRKGPKL